MSKEPKKYNIKTIEQIVNIVNEDNIENLSIDFALWLRQVLNVFTAVRKENPEVKDLLNSQIADVGFIWIDDNKNEIKFTSVEIKETGEVKTFYPKQ